MIMNLLGSEVVGPAVGEAEGVPIGELVGEVAQQTQSNLRRSMKYEARSTVGQAQKGDNYSTFCETFWTWLQI